MRASDVGQSFAEAVRHLQAGRLRDAQNLYEDILRRHPGHAESLHHLGLLAWGRRDGAAAETAIGRALQIRPGYAEAWSNYGVVLLGLGKTAEAIAACRRAIGLASGNAAAWSNLANGLKTAGDAEAARAAYAQALALQPGLAEALAGLADCLITLGRAQDALDLCDRAIACAPERGAAHLALAHALRRLGRWEAAAQAYRAGLARHAGSAAALRDYGVVLHRLGRLDEAEATQRRAIASEPQAPDAHNDLGAVLLALNRPEDAMAACRAALAIEPGYAEAQANLGSALAQLGRSEDAIASYAAALARNPQLHPAAIEICSLRLKVGDWAGLAAASAEALAAGPDPARPVPPFAILTLSDAPAVHQRYARAYAAALRPVAAQGGAAVAEAAGRRLRLGYLSSDFHQHATATLVAGLFEEHDRRSFEIFGYSFGPDQHSAMRARLVAGLDHWIALRALAHKDAAARIKADGIDILVDLKGYTLDARPAILALRPAPIQVAYLGYPGTMGADFIDYALVDRIVVPPEQRTYYDEALVYLPHCYQPNDRRRRIAAPPPSRAACGLPPDGFVFCCFNAIHKVTEPVFAIWLDLLATLPQAVLWLLDAEPAARTNLRRAAAARGITPARLVFAPRLPLPDHLARLALADLFLDTLPYNAHTTGSEALWAGVPLLTCRGEAFAGRVGASLLAAVGLPELVAASLDDYAAAALFLARTPAVLAELRRRLARNRETAPLFDTARTARAIETACREMMRLAAAGLAPRPFAVSESGVMPIDAESL